MALRLLHTTKHTLKTLREVARESEGSIPDYAIVSHVWEGEEVSFQQLTEDSQCKESFGWKKIIAACNIADEKGIKWVWIDTCCIDRRSSAELTKAINSMFAWYRDAKECYAFLDDVTRSDDTGSRSAWDMNRFKDSRWFKRGWTLQELLAPKNVLFYGKNGESREFIDDREALSSRISDETGIARKYLGGNWSNIRSASVARRLSWAVGRQTREPEDEAYCLLGILDVNMPLIYGEGKKKAFERLQIETIGQTNDDSIFAWGIGRAYQRAGMLAESPQDFKGSHGVVNEPDPGQVAPVATMNTVVLTSSITGRAILTSWFLGLDRMKPDYIRLRCIDRALDHSPRTLWLGLVREQDGHYYRSYVSQDSMFWKRLSFTSSRQMSISARPYVQPASEDVPKSKWQLDFIAVRPLLSLWYVVRLLIILIILVESTAQPSGETAQAVDATDQDRRLIQIISRQMATLVTVLILILRGVTFNEFQFWFVLFLFGLINGLPWVRSSGVA